MKTVIIAMLCIGAILGLPLASAEPCLLPFACFPSDPVCDTVAGVLNVVVDTVNGVTCS